MIGLAIEVHRHTGPGLLESGYERYLCHEYHEAGIPFERPTSIPVIRKIKSIGDAFKAHIVVANNAIPEIKSVRAIPPARDAQRHTKSPHERTPHRPDRELQHTPPDQRLPSLHPVTHRPRKRSDSVCSVALRPSSVLK
jgi:GxxExxY protein